MVIQPPCFPGRQGSQHDVGFDMSVVALHVRGASTVMRSKSMRSSKASPSRERASWTFRGSPQQELDAVLSKLANHLADACAGAWGSSWPRFKTQESEHG